MSFEMVPFDGYGLLFAFYNNYGSIFSRLASKNGVTLKSELNRASARADTQMTHRKESNTESGHNTKWLITANGPLQS